MRARDRGDRETQGGLRLRRRSATRAVRTITSEPDSPTDLPGARPALAHDAPTAETGPLPYPERGALTPRAWQGVLVSIPVAGSRRISTLGLRAIDFGGLLEGRRIGIRHLMECGRIESNSTASPLSALQRQSRHECVTAPAFENVARSREPGYENPGSQRLSAGRAPPASRTPVDLNRREISDFTAHEGEFRDEMTNEISPPVGSRGDTRYGRFDSRPPAQLHNFGFSVMQVAEQDRAMNRHGPWADAGIGS